MKKDIVLTSPDPFLLMRMFTDLQMDGRFDDDLRWNKYRIPFLGYSYLCIEGNIVYFLTGNWTGMPQTHLTESNYLSTLKMILE